MKIAMAHFQNHVVLYRGPIMEGHCFQYVGNLLNFQGLRHGKLDCNCLKYFSVSPPSKCAEQIRVRENFNFNVFLI